MKQIDRFIRKHGPVKGPLIFRLLKKNAANGRWKAWYRDRRAGSR